MAKVEASTLGDNTADSTALSASAAPADAPASAPADADAPDNTVGRPNWNEFNGLRYVGFSDIRSLSNADLQSLGVDDFPSEDGLVWSPANGYVVRKSHLNAATADALLEKLPSEFRVV